VFEPAGPVQLAVNAAISLGWGDARDLEAPLCA
jgi:hypothetical protein